MTRAKQIKLALKELGGAGRAEIELALDRIATERVAWERARQLTATDTKKALNKIASAMHRAQQALNRLPQDLRDELGYSGFATCKDACETLRCHKRGRSGDHMKMVAAREAQKLLRHFGLRVSTTRLGQWDSLSAALYGDPRQRFSVQFKKLEKERKNGNL